MLKAWRGRVSRSRPKEYDGIKTSLIELDVRFKVSRNFRILPTANSSKEKSIAKFFQTDDDNVSSVCDVPTLPGIAGRLHFHTDLSAGKKTQDSNSQLGCSSSLGAAPRDTESGTDVGDESGYDIRFTVESKHEDMDYRGKL